MPFRDKRKYRKYIREYMRKYRRKQKRTEDMLFKALSNERILHVIQQDFPDLFSVIEKKMKRRRGRK